MKTHAQIAVECPPLQAWNAVIDFDGRSKHSPRVKEATVVEGGGLAVGKHLSLRIDNSRLTMAVEELRSPSVLRLTLRGPLFHGGHRYTVVKHDYGAQVRIDADYGGPLGTVFGLFTKGKVRRDLTDELDAIKRQAEEPGKARWPTA